MTNSGVAPEWVERLERVEPLADPRVGILNPPLSRAYAVGRVHLVNDLNGAERLVQTCLESPVSWIAIDMPYWLKMCGSPLLFRPQMRSS